MSTIQAEYHIEPCEEARRAVEKNARRYGVRVEWGKNGEIAQTIVKRQQRSVLDMSYASYWAFVRRCHTTSREVGV